jgi:uncharacterized protein (DUF1499 family)
MTQSAARLSILFAATEQVVGGLNAFRRRAPRSVLVWLGSVALVTAGAAVVALTTGIAAGAASSDRHATNSPPDMTMFTDFAALDRPSRPNNWLVAPATARQADARAPEFDVSAAQLAEAWKTLVQKQPRTRIVGVSDDHVQVEAEQRSAVFGFVDKISFRAIPIGAGRSTLFAYSRSQTGYWDLGVNRNRLKDWLAALQRAVGQGEPR